MAKQIIKGNSGDWELVIGLEVHAQVISKAKLFSGSATEFGAAPNTQVSFIDAAMPGMLPVLNEECVRQAVRTGLGLKAQINKKSIFDRKHYFYADLPQGYQISQFHQPIVGKGKIQIDLSDNTSKEIGITRLHLEQDAGKSMHDQSPNETFIDLNRAGVALMEIVSEPDMQSSEEAGEYLKKLRSILRYLGTCDGDMEKGSMRCDVNVSVRRLGSDKLGTRAEVKNVNSIKNMMRAIDFEANRQVAILESGGEIAQETRLFDASTGETRSMRSKEDAHDYRYFPDPDLPPLVISEAYIEEIKQHLPELPDQKKDRYTKEMGLSTYDASVLVAEKVVADYFEAAASNCNAKMLANWITVELFAKLNKAGLAIENSLVNAKQMASLINLISSEVISGKIAKQVFEIMFTTGQDPELIVEREGLKQVKDTGAIEKIIAEILAANTERVAEYKSGKDKLFGYFVGQIMKATAGKANPEMVNEILKKLLAQ
jgi:aspartyl-tRNA(Asn)/glutamyl-tRNA(Gln) amidotransferase subunit B